MTAATAEAPKIPRSYWSWWTTGDNRVGWCVAPDGGFWWGSPVLIERMTRPPKKGTETDSALKHIEEQSKRETIPVPTQYTLQPAVCQGDPATRNYGKVGADTLLLNDDYAAHFERKSYTMRRVVGKGVEPVLLYRGDTLMGLVMPLVSPEYVERRKPKLWWQPAEAPGEVQIG